MDDLMENTRIAGRGGAFIFFSNIVYTLISAVGFLVRLSRFQRSLLQRFDSFE